MKAGMFAVLAVLVVVLSGLGCAFADSHGHKDIGVA